MRTCKSTMVAIPLSGKRCWSKHVCCLSPSPQSTWKKPVSRMVYLRERSITACNSSWMRRSSMLPSARKDTRQRSTKLITGNSIRMQRICQKCGRTTNFRSPAIDYIIREQKTQSFFMQHYTLLLYGECRKCKMLEAKAKKKAKA